MVEVPATRLGAWLDGFAKRNDGPPEVRTVRTGFDLLAPNGTTASVEVPYPESWAALSPGTSWPLTDLVAHVLLARDVVALLVRRGGYAVGVRVLDDTVFSKNGTKYVQGRTAAGGWSQQRFARRRAGQTATIVDAASQALIAAHGAAFPLSEASTRPLVVVHGGDRALVDQSLADLPKDVAQWLNACEMLSLNNIGDPRKKHLDRVLASPTVVKVKITD